MSIILINEQEYDVKLNKMFLQPHIMINGITTDIGMWDNTVSEEQDKLLSLAALCYEYNKKNNSLTYDDFRIHNSEKISGQSSKNKKHRWWHFLKILS